MLHQQNDFFIRANKSISETSGSSLAKSQSSLEDPMLDPETYVGYQTKSLIVDKDYTTGPLRKLVKDVNIFQRELFPLRYFRLHRGTGTVEIGSAQNGPFKHKIDGSDVIYAAVSRTILQKKPPNDFSFMFELRIAKSTFTLFACTSRERDIWIHEFSYKSKIKGQNLSHAQVQKQLAAINRDIAKSRDDNMSLESLDILPQGQVRTRGNSLNSLIQSPGGTSRREDGKLSNQLYRTLKPSVPQQQDVQYIEYMEDGFVVYNSKTLQHRKHITKGVLFFIEGSDIRDAYMTIDFKRLSIMFDLGQHNSKKNNIWFSDVINVENPKIGKSLLLQTTSKTFAFSAISDKERDLWQSAFQKIMVMKDQEPEIPQRSASKSPYNNKESKHMASKSPVQFEEYNRMKNCQQESSSCHTYLQPKQSIYRSKTMELSRMLIQGVVQKKIEHVEWYHTKHFHEKFIKVDFATAKILIYKQKGDKAPQHTIGFERIQGVSSIEDLGSKEKQDGVYGSSQPYEEPVNRSLSLSFLRKFSNNDSLDRTQQRSSSITKGCEWVFPFELRSDTKHMTLHCPSREDREAWLRVFRIIQHMTLHNFHHSTLQPLEYEGKFMLRTLPPNFTSSLIKDVSTNSLGLENGRLLNKTQYFQEYIESDFIVYESQNMKRNRNYVTGKLYIKSANTKGILSNTTEYEPFHVIIDYCEKLVKCSYDPALLEGSKVTDLIGYRVIPFIYIIKAVFDQPEESEEVLFRNKFNIYTREFNLELYAKTVKESDMWVEAFCRAIEIKHKSGFTNWAEESKMYLEQKKEWQGKKDKSAPSRLLISLEAEVDGMEEFKSTNMYFNCNLLEGYLMKKIMNKKVYHTKSYHKKFFRIFFQKGDIHIMNNQNDNEPQRIIPITSLYEIKALSQNEISDTNNCPWHFAFLMKTLECTMQLHVATQEEFKKWIRMLSLLIEMRKANVPLHSVNPFQYLRMKSMQASPKDSGTGSEDSGSERRNSKPVTLRNLKQESAKGPTAAKPLSKQERNKERRKKSLEDQQEIEGIVSVNIKPYQSLTINSAFSFIEGYLLKKVDSKNFYNLSQFHLRYFRIVFQSNTMIVKNDKGDTKTNKEISLSELVNAEYSQIKESTTSNRLKKSDSASSDIVIFLECCGNREIRDFHKHAYKETHDHIMQHYKINERKKECQWVHRIRLETRDRTFELHSPSKKEASLWLRVLKLIIRMNQKGINASHLNPYVFEEQEKKKLNQSIERNGQSASKEMPMTLNFFNSGQTEKQPSHITVQNITIMSQNVNLGEISGESRKTNITRNEPMIASQSNTSKKQRTKQQSTQQSSKRSSRQDESEYDYYDEEDEESKTVTNKTSTRKPTSAKPAQGQSTIGSRPATSNETKSQSQVAQEEEDHSDDEFARFGNVTVIDVQPKVIPMVSPYSSPQKPGGIKRIQEKDIIRPMTQLEMRPEPIPILDNSPKSVYALNATTNTRYNNKPKGMGVSIEKCLQTLQRKSIERESLNMSTLSLKQGKLLDPSKISFVKNPSIKQNATFDKLRYKPNAEQRSESQYQMPESVRRKTMLILKRNEDPKRSESVENPLNSSIILKLKKKKEESTLSVTELAKSLQKYTATQPLLKGHGLGANCETLDSQPYAISYTPQLMQTQQTQHSQLKQNQSIVQRAKNMEMIATIKKKTLKQQLGLTSSLMKRDAEFRKKIDASIVEDDLDVSDI